MVSDAALNLPIPLRELLADPTVEALHVDGPGPVWVEREGAWSVDEHSLSSLDIEDVASQAVRRAGARPGQLHVSALFPGHLRVELVRSAVVPGGSVLVISRERVSSWTLEELLEDLDEDGREPSPLGRIIELLDAQRQGVLIVAPNERLRSIGLAAILERLPKHERALLIDSGRFLPPERERLLRLWINPSRGATRQALLLAATRLRVDRVLLDTVDGPEVGELLRGAGEGLGAPIVGIAGRNPAEGLTRLENLALSLGGLDRGAGALIGERFGLVLQLGEDGQRRPQIEQVCEQWEEDDAPVDPPLEPLPSAAPRVATPQVAPEPADEPPQRSPQVPTPEPSAPVLEPTAALDWSALDPPSSTERPRPARPSGVTRRPPPTRVTRRSQEPARARAKAVQQAPWPELSPTSAPEPRNDIFDEMFAALPGMSAEPTANPWPAPPPVSAAHSDELDDSLLFGGAAPGADRTLAEHFEDE